MYNNIGLSNNNKHYFNVTSTITSSVILNISKLHLERHWVTKNDQINIVADIMIVLLTEIL